MKGSGPVRLEEKDARDEKGYRKLIPNARFIKLISSRDAVVALVQLRLQRHVAYATLVKSRTTEK